ncbi:hypothetical protein [Algivirga pacifica]|uniref:T9SS type A sorting domain-containing protein n=1 Tax=Algivirga pacifica TaxID=1162670 RepID=A0ABP9D2P0_9BACT
MKTSTVTFLLQKSILIGLLFGGSLCWGQTTYTDANPTEGYDHTFASIAGSGTTIAEKIQNGEYNVVNGDFTINGSTPDASSITNNGILIVTGNFELNNGFFLNPNIFTNNGTIIVLGNFSTDGTNTIFSNGGNVIVYGDAELNGNDFNNDGGEMVVGGELSGTALNTGTGELYADDDDNFTQRNDDLSTQTGSDKGIDDIPDDPLGDIIDAVNDIFDTSGALPVEMAYFTASRQGEGIVLEWSTTSEENNDFFEVQRSIDGKSYTVIEDAIEGRGEGTQNGQDYRFVDAQAPKGLVYYRLKQVDIDGKFEYYNMVVNPAATQRTFSVDNYSGNPLRGQDMELQLYNPITQQIYMVLVNTQGQVTYERRLSLKGGYTRLQIPADQISKGMSVLKIISATKQETIKLLNP